MNNAMAIDASAAAIATTISTKKFPCNWFGKRYLLKTKKLIFTEFNINSIDIRIVMRLWRIRKPQIPTKNMMVLTIKKY